MSGDLLVELEPLEIAMLHAGIGALRPDEVDGECVWLRLESTCHRWAIITRAGRFDLTVHHAHDVQLGRWLPVSERTLRFAEDCHPDRVTLRLVDDTVLASADGISAAIDLVRTRAAAPTLATCEPVAGAVVSAARFTRALQAARVLPGGAAEVDWLSPPMWLHIDEDEVALHVDWTDVLQSRSTYRVSSEHGDGDETVSISHAAIGAFIDRVPDVDEFLTISLGRDDRLVDEPQVLWIDGEHWRLTTRTRDTLDERWSGRITELCEEQRWTVRERIGNAWALTVGDCEVHLGLQHGHPDVARVSVAVATGLEESADLLRELNSLNLASAGRRFVLHDGTVHVTTDVRLSDFPMLRVAVGEVVQDARRYGALLGIHTAV